MGIEFNYVSQDAQIRLTEFREDFTLALSQETTPDEDWARTMGLYVTGRSLKTKWPIPISAAGYKEFEGDVKYRSIFEKSFELVPKTWQDGVAELASVIEAPDFTGWAMQPEAMASAALALGNEIISAALEVNAVHPLDGLTFFNAAHPFNVLDVALGTFANTFSGAGTAASTAALETAKTNMRKIKAANGKPAGFRVTHILAHPDKEETWRGILERDLIIESNGANNFGTVRNRHMGTVKLVISDQLTTSLQWYAISLNKRGAYPWVFQQEPAPEEIISDKSSHLYKTTLKVGYASVLRGNGGLALPHCIHRYVGA